MPKSLVLIFVIPLLLTSCGGDPEPDYEQGYEEGFDEGTDWICDQRERSLPSQIYAQYEPRGC